MGQVLAGTRGQVRRLGGWAVRRCRLRCWAAPEASRGPGEGEAAQRGRSGCQPLSCRRCSCWLSSPCKVRLRSFHPSGPSPASCSSTSSQLIFILFLSFSPLIPPAWFPSSPSPLRRLRPPAPPGFLRVPRRRNLESGL